MSDLLKKLNVLVRSSINDVLGEDWAVGAPRRRPLTPEKLGKDIDREIASLRQRINDALAYEDELQARVRSLQNETTRLDQQADQAVVSANDMAARAAVEQLQRAQQRLRMAESDLHEHQVVTQELIQRVNMLEAAVADTRRAQDQHQQPVSAPPAEPSEAARLPSLSDVLKEAREKIAQMGDMIATQSELAAPQPNDLPDEPAVEDDLAARRQRLSKK